MSVRDLLDRELFRLHDTPVTIAALLAALLVIVVGWLVSTGVQRALRRAWRRRARRTEGNLHAILRLVHYAVMLVALGVAFETVGFDLGTLFAAGAIFAIGLGFAMQNIAQNFVSGVILLLERAIKPGDIIEVDGTVVRVEELGMRATLVRTRVDEEMIVPNGVLVQSTIKNFTLRDSLYRIRAPIGVAYESDLAVVRQALEQAAEGFEPRFADKAPIVLLLGFGASSVDFEVSVWTDDPWAARPLLSKLNERIWHALQAAGVRIPFAQHDVHLDEAVVSSLRRLADARPRRDDEAGEAPRRPGSGPSSA